MTETARNTVPLELRWFESNGLHMVIDRSGSSALSELGVPAAQQAVVSDLIDAVLLDEQDPLLRCLDAWCGLECDWQPWRPNEREAEKSTTPEQKAESADMQLAARLHELKNCPGLTVSLTSFEGTPRIIWLAIDAVTLANMPALPEHWQSLVKVNRHLLPCTVQLQEFTLTAQELSKLGAGSLILLSESYQDHWQASIRAAESTLNETSARIDVTDQLLRLAPRAIGSENVNAPDDGSNVLVELADELMINELYTRSVWQAGLNMAIPLPQALDGARVVVRHLHADTSLSSPSVWGGRLIKVGEGFGVLLNSSDG